MDRRKAADNSTYKKLAVQWLNEALCFVSSFVVADSLVLRNRQLLVAANRYASPSRWTSIKQIDTHGDRFSQKTNPYSDTRTAQILCVNIFQFVFRADHTSTAQA